MINPLKCDISYVCKQRNGKAKYWCKTHKSKVSNNGILLEECLCENKEDYCRAITMKEQDIKSIVLEVSNILENPECIIKINDKKLDGVLYLDNGILEKNDFIGLLLAKINNEPLSKVKCSFCHHLHNDNRAFAITPHRKHQCMYCGHEFYEKVPNIGNELVEYFEIPKIKLEYDSEQIDNNLVLYYDVLSGKVKINHNSLFYSKDKIEIKNLINDLFLPKNDKVIKKKYNNDE